MPDSARLLLLDRDVVESLSSPADVLEAVREAFVLHSKREGRIFPVVREALATGGVFGIKAGDRAQAIQTGKTQWTPDTPGVEPGDLLTGNAQFKRDRHDITVST